MIRRIGPVLILILLTTGGALAEEPNRFGLSYPHAAGLLSFPLDEGGHSLTGSGDGIEIWSLAGHLDDPDGRSWGFHLGFHNLALPWLEAGQPDMPEMWHYRLADPAGGEPRWVHDGPTLRDFWIRTDRLGLSWEGSSLRCVGPFVYDLVLDDPARSVRLELRLTAAKYPVVVGLQGTGHLTPSVSQQGYQLTRVEAAGELTVDGVASPVYGTVGLDHRWFSLESDDLVEWGQRGLSLESFQVVLEDGSELVLWQHVRPGDGEGQVQGVQVVTAEGYDLDFDPQGAPPGLEPSVEPLGGFQGVESGRSYSQGWHLSVPQAELALTLLPDRVDQELPCLVHGMNLSAWIGDCRVVGTAAGREVRGRGSAWCTAGHPEPLSPDPPGITAVEPLDGALDISWSGSATGYRLHWGSESLAYENSLDLFNRRRYVLADLPNHEPVFLTVTGYDETGESWFAPERRGVPNPGFPTLELSSNHRIWGSGERMLITAGWTNPGPSVRLELYAALQLGPEWYFAPHWTTQPRGWPAWLDPESQGAWRVVDLRLPVELPSMGPLPLVAGLVDPVEGGLVGNLETREIGFR